MKNTGIKNWAWAFATLVFGFIVSNTATAQNVVAWGNNTAGEINVPPGATNVISVAAGWYHSLALRNDGTVISWGAISSTPDEATNVVGISAGASNNVALKADGSVLCWGDNSWGQTNVPVFPTNVVSISAGNFHILALMADGTVMAWGKNTYGQCTIPNGLSNVIAVSAGAEHSMAMKDDGSVIIWGGSNVFPLSSAKYGLPYSSISLAEMAAGATCNLYLSTSGYLYQRGNYKAYPASSATNIVAIAAGTNFSLALNNLGRLYGWGAGTATNPPASATNIIAMAVGLAHGLAVRGDGSPNIIGSPAFQNLTSAGNYLPLFARAVGKSALQYQWLADGVPIIGATNALPSIPAVWGADSVAYQVVVSNTLNVATSSVVNIAIRSFNLWGYNTDGQTTIPRSVINPVAVATGPFHNLAIQGDGTIAAWGKNWNGQTNVPTGATNIIAVACGSDHSLALKNDGSVIAWGKNLDGQTNVPASASNVVAVAAGWAHSVALRADGTVIAWGNNDYGQISVSFLASQVISIAAGYYHTLALRADGHVVSWGYQTDVPASATNITAIAAGWGHNLALRADGTILGWGDNTFGQSTIPSSATNVIAIAAGWYHSMALRADGTLICWGKPFKRSFITNTPAGLFAVGTIDAGEDFCAAMVQTGSPRSGTPMTTLSVNRDGQLFFRPTIQGSLPMTFQWSHNGITLGGQTNSYLLIPTAQISDGGNYELIVSNPFGVVTNAAVSYSVTGNPAIYSALGAWGNDLDGQCDVAPGIKDPVDVAAGAFHNLALQGDGTVIAWGKNWSGQTNVPGSVTNVIAIAAGSDHSLALRNDGTVVAWGKNTDGQTNVPASVSNVVAIAAGWAHCLALRADGRVIAWGNNDYGQTNTPDNLTDVIAIAAGYYHNLALRSDHSIVSWGSQYIVPASVRNAVAISAGWEHNLALTGDGKVIAWGDNSYGQCSVPPTVTFATAIRAGFGHSLVRLNNGTIVSWGKNYFGVTNAPSGLNNVAGIACGEDHELAIVANGPPQIQLEAQTTPAHFGGNGLLKANLVGTYPLNVQWYRDSFPVASATNCWLLLTNLQSADTGKYTLIVSNNAGQTSSAAVIYDVSPAPYFLTPLPPQINNLVGAPLRLTIDADGVQPLVYQSQLNGGTISDNGRITGTTSQNLFFDPTTFEDSGSLTMIVTNDFGSYTGLVANVAITPVIGWGDNSSGQLQVPASATNVAAIASGGDHNLALLADGTVAAWGDNSFGQNNVPASANQAVAIAEGDTHSLALKSDGSVIAWGDNTFGQTNVPGTVLNAVAITAGTRFSQALMPDGSVIQWGALHSLPATFTNVMLLSSKGTHSIALRGDGTIVDSLQGLVLQTNVISVCAGKSDSLALLADGSLVAWGKNVYGQTNIPASATNIVAMAAGEDHFVALRADGVVIAWGSTNFGQIQIPALTQSIGLISAGSVHSLAVLGQPFQRMARAGESVVFSAGTIANRLATYQWQFNGADIPGATNSTYSVGNAYWSNSGIYRVVISNAVGTVTSPAMTLTVPPLKLDVAGFNLDTTNGAVQIRLIGSSGLNPVTFYTSSNLLDWVPVFTNPPTPGTIDFTDMPPNTISQRFYRAIEQP